MDADRYRALALALPHVLEKPHFDRAAFRVDVTKGKNFTTLAGDGASANLLLNSDEQTLLCTAEPKLFAPVSGGWGKQGWTVLTLAHVDEPTAKSALQMAWRHAAPEKYHAELDT